MASISASVELYDGMSGVLRDINSALNMTVSSLEEMQGSLSDGLDASSVSGMRSAINQANASLATYESQVRGAGDSQNELNNKFSSGNTAANALSGTVKKLAAAYLSFQTVSSIVDTSDELVSIEARLNTMNIAFNEMNGTATETSSVFRQIYAAAQDARGSFSDMASIVARFGNNARDAFSDQSEVVEFASLIQKQMTIAGASTEEASNAMLQLSQALGSGVLRGDELNSIFEQAPNLIQAVADYMDVPIGKIREMASEGELTADVVKAAIFASADDINEAFAEMPMTFGQMWTTFKNSALMAFKPVLSRINEIWNSEKFTTFANNAMSALCTLSNAALSLFDTMAGVANYISEHWAVIGPLVLGAAAAVAAYNAALAITKAITVAAAAAQAIHTAATGAWSVATFAQTAAQQGLNAAMQACPIVWIIDLIILAIAAIYAACAAVADFTGAANSGFSLITGGINVVLQFFKNLWLFICDFAIGVWNALSALGSNIVTAFQSAISSVQSLFYSLLSTALSVIESIAAALNELPFVEFDYSGITDSASEYAAKARQASDVADDSEYTSISDAFSKGMSTYDAYSLGWASDAFASGSAWGDGVTSKISNLWKSSGASGSNSSGLAASSAAANLADSAAQTAANTGDTANSTGAIADSVSASAEDLKYLRDIAERDAVNRFTTAEITVNQTNNNTVSGTADIDGMVSKLTTGVNEALNIAAEGVHK